jgi:hypothetical protein
MINFQLVNWYALLGLFITVILGFGTKYLVRHVAKSLPLESPNSELEPYWGKFRTMKAAGGMIGHVERPILFAALYLPNGWPILTSWLAFKLAYYWQSANFASFPSELPKEEEQMKWIVAKRQLGTHHAATALVGTGANIILALVGVSIAKWIRFQ